MRFVLSLLVFISLPLFATSILNYKIQENEMQNIEILLYLDGKWNGTVEQKNDNEDTVFIFKNLKTKLSAQKVQNSPTIEYINLNQSNASESHLILRSRQIFDVNISNDTNDIRISLIPKPAPITIEGIANGVNGGVLAYILDALFYIVIVLAFFCAAFFVFIKLKLFPRIHAKTQTSIVSPAKEIVEPLDKLDESEETLSIKAENEGDTKNIERQEKGKRAKAKSSQTQKKSKQTKSLFDL
jgi:hypothetical protein